MEIQKKRKFDKKTMRKIGNGFLIAAIAALGMGFIDFIPEFNQWIAVNDPIAWRIVFGTMFKVFSSGVVNAYYQWEKGE